MKSAVNPPPSVEPFEHTLSAGLPKVTSAGVSREVPLEPPDPLPPEHARVEVEATRTKARRGCLRIMTVCRSRAPLPAGFAVVHVAVGAACGS